MSTEVLLTGGAALLGASVLLSKLASRAGVPALLLFLAVGMLAGSEGPGGIAFDNAPAARTLGVAALVYILFAGGLETDWAAVRPVLKRGLSLATVGVVTTAAVMAAFAVWALGFSWREGMLLGAIVSSTDAAAVFSVLGAAGVGLKGGLRPLLELESGSNDPMAVFLTTGLVQLMTRPEFSWGSLAGRFVLQMSLGAALGYGLGLAALALLNRIKLEQEGLYPPLTLALVMLVYGATAFAGGNGFLAVYVAGLTLGRRNFSHKRTILRFQDGTAWLMQIAMFLALGLLVFPRQLVPVAGEGLLSSLALIFAARPVAVFASLAFARMGIRERLMVSWVGLRGAVPVVLATFPLMEGLDPHRRLFHLVFFIVLTSVLIQGTGLPRVARLLGVAAPPEPRPRRPLDFDPMDGSDMEMADFIVPYGSPVSGKTLVEVGLPKGSRIILLNRDEDFLLPTGDTVLEEGDVLLTLVAPGNLPEVRRKLTGQSLPPEKPRAAS